MRHLRLTLTDAAILVAIAALLCAVPIHWGRALDEDMCRSLGAIYIAKGEEMAEMAGHPEPWMDPFRGGFRRFSAWQVAKGHRIAGSPRYDAADEQRRIEEAGMDRYEAAFRPLDAQFKGVAALHGYQRPSIPPRYTNRSLFGILGSAWPLYAAIIVLGVLFVLRRWREDRRTRPSGNQGRGAATAGTEGTGVLLLLLSVFYLGCSLFESAIPIQFPVPGETATWSVVLRRMFDVRDGSGLQNIVALAGVFAGLSFIVMGIREQRRPPPIDSTIPVPEGRAVGAESPRADDPGPSP